MVGGKNVDADRLGNVGGTGEEVGSGVHVGYEEEVLVELIRDADVLLLAVLADLRADADAAIVQHDVASLEVAELARPDEGVVDELYGQPELRISFLDHSLDAADVVLLEIAGRDGIAAQLFDPLNELPLTGFLLKGPDVGAIVIMSRRIAGGG